MAARLTMLLVLIMSDADVAKSRPQTSTVVTSEKSSSGGNDVDDSTMAAWMLQTNALQSCHQVAPLGMISGSIGDWQISSSSVYPAEWDAGCADRNGRLYQPNGLAWCARYKSSSEWLQIDLGVLSRVTGLMTQGRSDGKEWVTSFSVSYSRHETRMWQYVNDQYGNRRVFDGNSDSYAAKHSYLDEPIAARFVKFHTIRWNGHPSMRVEIIGCQACNHPIAQLPFGKMAASSERVDAGGSGSTCRATDGSILTNKGWCPRNDNANQWLQFDVGPPTLVTGVVTKGRGDHSRDSWVVRYRVSYSNDSSIWYFYSDKADTAARQWRRSNTTASSSSDLVPDLRGPEGLEFGANNDRDTERKQYLNSPFIARYIRLHPTQWHQHIGLRAGLVGCPRMSDRCEPGFMRISEHTPCVENVAYRKDAWMSDGRSLKRHALHHNRRTALMHRSAVPQWRRGGQAARAVDGLIDTRACAVLDSIDSERPAWMVDLGRRTTVAGIIVVTRVGPETGNRTLSGATSGGGYDSDNLDSLVVYVEHGGIKSASRLRWQSSSQQDRLPGSSSVCGTASNWPGGGLGLVDSGGPSKHGDAGGRRLHVACRWPMVGRYVFVEARGKAGRRIGAPLFSVSLCEVMVYQ